MGHGNEIAEKSQAKVKSEVNMAAAGHHRQACYVPLDL